MAYELDYQILLHIIASSSEDMMMQYESVLVDYFDEYMRFREICKVAGRDRQPDAGSPTIDDLRKGWRKYTSLSHNRFDELIRFYFLRFKQNARKKGRKGTVTELNTELSGHNKWYRMLNDHGIGNQYHDDMRKLCFIFQLSYAESVELLWSAGHPFDNGSLRDYIIAECLVNKTYDYEAVNKQLMQMKQDILFN